GDGERGGEVPRLGAGVGSNSQLSVSSQVLIPQDGVLAKLQSGLPNLTDIPLEIDILQVEKRRDLLYIVLQKFEEIVETLRFSQVTIEQLPRTRSRLLHDLWQVSLTDFFGKYSTLPVDNRELAFVDSLLQDTSIVQSAILDKIPLVVELLGNRLFDAPLMIDNVPYSAGTPEVLARSELLRENLIIQVANAVTQPLLNQFAD
ncbi:MAG TPA: DUF3685 domain-containing protein, partial [Cyanobacteria bacterium UBA11148]|nr:DUF3685 domain-containing protein [Cyanobacteria bacterium UBA11148]